MAAHTTTSAPALRHTTPAFRTFCGDDALSALPKEMDRVGARRVVIVCGASVRKHSEAFGRVEQALGSRLAGCFAEAKEHSPLSTVERARDLFDDLGADAVVAVGGGSAVVTARAATILHGEGGDVRDLCTYRADNGRLVSPRLTKSKLPQWVVATTPTTAYAKAGAAVRDPATGERLALFDPKARAQGIFLDPMLALTAPTTLVRTAALNALAMSVEGLQSALDDPLAEALLNQALRVLVPWLPRVDTAPDDGETRLRLMLGALLCGQGSDFVGGGLAQALSHAAGPRSSAPNGVVEALLLPHAMRWNAPETSAGLARVAAAIPVDKGDDVIDAVQRMLAEFGVPHRLRDVDVAATAVPEIAEHALDDWSLSALPRTPRHVDLVELLEAAW